MENSNELKLKQLNEIICQSQKLIELATELDPHYERQNKFKTCIEDGLRPYKDEAREKSKSLMKQMKQKPISDFFQKTDEKSVTG